MGLAIEKIIQEWLAKTSSEDIPGKGKPLDLDEYFSWPEDVRFAYSILKSSGYVPEEVSLMKEIGNLEQEVSRCVEPVEKRRLRQQLEERRVSLSLKLEQRRRRR